MNVLIVEDEPLSRELVEDNVSKIPYLRLVGSCSSGLAALEEIHTKSVDLVLLDIQMPGLTGLQFLESIEKPVLTILITAYEKYALDSYSLGVVDYLLKPVAFDRFLKAVNRAREIFSLYERQRNNKTLDTIFVQADYTLVSVELRDVTHIEGLKDYVKIHLRTSTKPIISRISLKQLESFLPPDQFLRVHKSFIVSIKKISSIRKGRILIGGTEIPIGETYAEDFFRLIQTV